jgi:hypothetical protein
MGRKNGRLSAKERRKAREKEEQQREQEWLSSLSQDEVDEHYKEQETEIAKTLEEGRELVDFMKRATLVKRNPKQ